MARKDIPNIITCIRLGLSVIFFVLLAVAPRPATEAPALLLDMAFAIFLLAVTTDFLDGYLARKWNVVSVFGRIADPFVDKIVIVGAFVLLIPLAEAILPAWVVVVILSREFLISAIRGYAESQGISFAATWAGKLKFWSQCVAIGACLLLLGRGRGVEGLEPLAAGLVWLAVIMTIWSGLSYLLRARRLFDSTLSTETDNAG